MRNSNVHALPTAVERLFAQVKNDLQRCRKGDREWIEGTYDLCIHLAELRDRFTANIEFGRECEAHGLGKDVLNRDDRNSAVGMGRDPDALRACLDVTDRRSLQTIYRFEFDRFRSVTKTTPHKIEKPKKIEKAYKFNKAFETCELFTRDGKEITEPAIVGASGISKGTVGKAIAAHRIAEKAKPQVDPLDPATAAPSVRQRMEAWQRAETKRIREQLQIEVKAEIDKEYDAYIKTVNERVARAKRIEEGHEGCITKLQYNKIVKCLHPDRIGNVSGNELGEAFRIFTALKDVLVKLETDDALLATLPQTAADLMARRRR